MDRERGNREKMRKCREWISLHFLNLSPFLHSLSISSFSLHFLFIFSFSFHFSTARLPGWHNLCLPVWDYGYFLDSLNTISFRKLCLRKSPCQVMSRIWNKNHEKKSKCSSLSFTIFASLPFSPRKWARHARHPLWPGLFTMIAQLPIEAQLARGKMGVGIVNLAFDGWETTTPVEWTNIYFFFVIGVCFKQWRQSQLQSRDNFELSVYGSFEMLWYDVRWFHLELFYLENFVFVSFGLYVGILCSGHWTVEKSCFCFLNLEIGLFDQIHFPSPTLQPGPSGYFFWIWAGLGRVLKKTSQELRMLSRSLSVY